MNIQFLSYSNTFCKFIFFTLIINLGKYASKHFASLEEMGQRLLFGLSMAKNFFIYFKVPFKCMDEEEVFLIS